VDKLEGAEEVGEFGGIGVYRSDGGAVGADEPVGYLALAAGDRDDEITARREPQPPPLPPQQAPRL
jgi:hypothetical protein